MSPPGDPAAAGTLGGSATGVPTAVPAPTQLRVATMLSGGASLSIWIGGATYEIDRLRRKEDLYGELAGIAGVEPVVDIIAGTSAGGLNGSLLAGASAWGSTLEELNQLWVDRADLARLLRPMTETDPPSLFEGDGYLLVQLNSYLRALQRNGGTDGLDLRPGTKEHPGLHAVLTTTLFNGARHDVTDAAGDVISEETNLGLFRFSKTPEQDDFDSPDGQSVARLARAARSSASLPFAFEPSFVEVGPGLETPDFTGVADFATSRWVMDGGLLDDAPIDEVLTLIAEQPATDAAVRRVVLYIDPLSGPPPDGVELPDSPLEPPALSRVLLDAVLLPRQRSTVAQLEQLSRRSRQHEQLQLLRRGLFEGRTWPDDLAEDAPGLVEAGRRLLPALASYRATDEVEQREQPTASEPDLAQARRNLLTVQDLLRRALLLAPGTAALAQCRTAISAAQDQILATVAGGDPAPGVATDPTAVLDTVALCAGVITRAMAVLVERLGLSRSAEDGSPGDQLRCEVAGIVALARVHLEKPAPAGGAGDTYVLDAPLRQGPAADQAWTAALTDLDVLQSVVTDGRTHNPQEVELVEVSAAALPAIGPAIGASEKLTGIQLMHLGAFYLPSWRQNDWTWGRLDGARQLVTMLVNPEALLETGQSSEALGTRLAALLSFASEDERARFASTAAGGLELVRNSEGAARATAMTATRDLLSQRLAEEAALRLLPVEIERLRRQLRADAAAGAALSERDLGFLSTPALGPSPGAREIVTAWSSCAVGADRLNQQMTSDHFGQVATQGAGVALNMLAGASIGVAGHQVTLFKTMARVGAPVLRFAHFLTTPAAATRTSRLIIGAAALVGTLLALVCSINAGNLIYLAIAAGIWVALGIGSLALHHLARYLWALGALAATVGLGLASHHWDITSLIVLATGVAVVAAFIAAFACHPDGVVAVPQAVPEPRGAGDGPAHPGAH